MAQMQASPASRGVGHVSLWFTLVSQDLAARYRGTLLGRAWPLLMPLLMLCIYGFVFGAVFRARWPGLAEDDHLGFAINLFIGLLVHGLLAEAVAQAPSLMQRNSNFVRKMVSRILPSCSAVSPALMASINRRMESSARSASS